MKNSMSMTTPTEWLLPNQVPKPTESESENEDKDSYYLTYINLTPYLFIDDSRRAEGPQR